MSEPHHQPTTGLQGLDRVLEGLVPGDNIVWQVAAVHDYARLVHPYAGEARRQGLKVVYFRFASHDPVLNDDLVTDICRLDPDDGFEAVIARIHATLNTMGNRAVYVFDCLSELASDWCSDQMLGNFFMLTCPHVYELGAIAYFAVFRDYHSSYALRPIADATQILIDLFVHEAKVYVRPVKVQGRYSAFMNMFHVQQGDDFQPITSSLTISELMASVKWSGLRSDRRLGYWGRTFVEAQEIFDQAANGRCSPGHEKECFDRLVRMCISRDPGILRLVSRFMTLADVLEVRNRMIGTGLIGGKAVGMLLARAMLTRTEPRFRDLLETHDSFFIGSDVFYTFLVRNGLWWARQNQKDSAHYLEGAEDARQAIMEGSFPDYTVRHFSEMLEYFGQSPIIVRSSSLLEDNFGNSFAGQYDSVFCANQGPPDKRLRDLLGAVRTVYASSMSESALRYRHRHDMLHLDEQMALLVMRVSGAMSGRHYFPAVAGVGYSFNPYAWHPDIDPAAGFVRLVFGLGTRAVNRSDDDYTRVVALNAPQRRPESNFDEVIHHAQRRVDYLDLNANRLVAGYFDDVSREARNLPMDLFVSRQRSRGDRRKKQLEILTFDRLLAQTDFVQDLRRLLQILEQAYRNPVDVEFTANFMDAAHYKISLVQCRPLPLAQVATKSLSNVRVTDGNRIIEAHSAVIGRSRVVSLSRLIFISPSAYAGLSISRRYQVARVIGDLNALTNASAEQVMLLGPGRWGTNSPSLGVPVAFADINHVTALCEIVTMREGLMPDVSLGTHFLNELVETDMLYLALFPQKGDNYLNLDFFESSPNALPELLPAAKTWTPVVKVIEAKQVISAANVITLAADAAAQQVICFFERAAPHAPRAGARQPT